MFEFGSVRLSRRGARHGRISNDLMVTVQLSGIGGAFQFDRMGFNSDINSGFALDCFNFEAPCSSPCWRASLGRAEQEG